MSGLRFQGHERRECEHLPWTRFWSSATIRGSSSTAITFLTRGSILVVRLPVPGPISSTTSVDLSLAFDHQMNSINFWVDSLFV